MKLAGIFLLFGVCILIGREISAGWKRRLRTAEAMRALVILIAEQIDSFSAPLEEIYGKCREDCLAESGFLSVLAESGWSAALDVLPDLDDGVRQVMAAFGEEIGRGSREQELARCRHTAARLEQLAEGMRAELPKRTKLCRSLTLMAGMAVAIILI